MRIQFTASYPVSLTFIVILSSQ